MGVGPTNDLEFPGQVGPLQGAGKGDALWNKHREDDLEEYTLVFHLNFRKEARILGSIKFLHDFYPDISPFLI